MKFYSFFLFFTFYSITTQTNTITYQLKRYIPVITTDSLKEEEKYFPYNFTSDIFEGGIFVFDTASFYSWKNNETFNEIINVSFTTKTNKKKEGIIKINENNYNWILVSKSKNDISNFGSICIPKKIPDHIKLEMSWDGTNDTFYNYLDILLTSEEKYINYIHKNTNEGYISFGSKDDIFIKEKDIKRCECILPKSDDTQYDYFNFWNCGISSFYANNDEINLKYSLTGSINLYAIFAMSEEYIIGPKNTGTEIMDYYKDLIKSSFGKNCYIELINENTNILVCETFDYSGVPDFSVFLQGEIPLVALSNDLFKNKNESYIYFKIIVNLNLKDEFWFLGDPIMRNYNFLFDYNIENKETVSIVYTPLSNDIYTLIGIGISTLLFILYLIYVLIGNKKRQEQLTRNKNLDDDDEQTKKNLLKTGTTLKFENEDEENTDDVNNDFSIPKGNIPNRNSSYFIQKDIKEFQKNKMKEIELTEITGEGNGEESEEKENEESDDSDESNENSDIYSEKSDDSDDVIGSKGSRKKPSFHKKNNYEQKIRNKMNINYDESSDSNNEDDKEKNIINFDSSDNENNNKKKVNFENEIDNLGENEDVNDTPSSHKHH